MRRIVHGEQGSGASAGRRHASAARQRPRRGRTQRQAPSKQRAAAGYSLAFAPLVMEPERTYTQTRKRPHAD